MGYMVCRGPGTSELMDDDSVGTEGTIVDITAVEVPIHIGDIVYRFEGSAPWDKLPEGVTWISHGPGAYVAVRVKVPHDDSVGLVQTFRRTRLHAHMPDSDCPLLARVLGLDAVRV